MPGAWKWKQTFERMERATGRRYGRVLRRSNHAEICEAIFAAGGN